MSDSSIKRNLVPLLGIAFVVAVISTGVFYGLLAGRVKPSANDPEGRSLVVAARSLERGAVLTAADLKLRPVTSPSSGSLSSPVEAVGRTLLQSAREGAVLSAASLSKREARGGAALAIPAAMRAVSVRVTESLGVVSRIQSGNRVDVQVISRRGDASQLRTVLDNMEVLWREPVESNRGLAVVTLLATPREAEMLSLADATSQIRLVLRNPSDNGARVSPPLRATPPVARAADPEIEYRVRVVRASAGSLQRLVPAFSPGPNVPRASPIELAELAAAEGMRIVSDMAVVSHDRKSLTFLSGSGQPGACSLRFDLRPQPAGPHRVRLVVRMAASGCDRSPASSALDFELTEGRGYLLTGFGGEHGDAELVALVTASRNAPLQMAAR